MDPERLRWKREEEGREGGREGGRDGIGVDNVSDVLRPLPLPVLDDEMDSRSTRLSLCRATNAPAGGSNSTASESGGGRNGDEGLGNMVGPVGGGASCINPCGRPE